VNRTNLNGVEKIFDHGILGTHGRDSEIGFRPEDLELDFILSERAAWASVLVVSRKIRQLVSDLEKAGFSNRGGKGSHRNFLHNEAGASLTLSGQLGADAKI
jgi:predicted RNA binding protein YcfA (HicA-like mRNA interferase family)